MEAILVLVWSAFFVGIGWVVRTGQLYNKATRGHVADGILTFRAPVTHIKTKANHSQEVTLMTDLDEGDAYVVVRMAKGENMFGLGLRYQVEIKRIE